MTVSLNYQRKFDFNRDFDFEYTQSREDLVIYRDFAIEQEGGLHALTPAIAFEIVPTFSVGVAFNVWGSEFFKDTAWRSQKTLHRTRVDPNSGTVQSAATVVETQEFDDFSGWNATLGFLWNVTSYLNLGAVVNLPFRAELRVRQRIENTELPLDDLQRLETFEQDIEMLFPVSYGLGVALRPIDPLTFSLDYMRVDWEDFVYRDEAGNQYSVITSQPAVKDGDADVGASNTVRFGVEYLFIWPNLVWPVRAGFFYDPEPAAGGTDDYFGFTVGTGITFKWVTLDLAYVFKFGNDIKPSNITDIRNLDTARADVTQHTILLSTVARF